MININFKIFKEITIYIFNNPIIDINLNYNKAYRLLNELNNIFYTFSLTKSDTFLFSSAIPIVYDNIQDKFNDNKLSENILNDEIDSSSIIRIIELLLKT